MTRTDLPVGTYVLVTERGPDARPPYFARVVGTDLFGSKYQVGMRYGGWGQWLFLDGGSWAFPEWVREVTEAEATAIEATPTPPSPAA